MGGFTQVGSHGSGATIPPVDEQVVSMKLVTPAQGCLELSQVMPCPALVCCTGHVSVHMRVKLHVGLAVSTPHLLLVSQVISDQARPKSCKQVACHLMHSTDQLSDIVVMQSCAAASCYCSTGCIQSVAFTCKQSAAATEANSHLGNTPNLSAAFSVSQDSH